MSCRETEQDSLVGGDDRVVGVSLSGGMRWPIDSVDILIEINYHIVLN